MMAPSTPTARRALIWSMGALVLLAVGIGLIWWWRAAHQPRWGGKTVEQWFADFRVARGVHEANFFSGALAYRTADSLALFDDPAAHGLRALGRPAVAWLTKEVAHGDGLWSQKYQNMFPNLPSILRKCLP